MPGKALQMIIVNLVKLNLLPPLLAQNHIIHALKPGRIFDNKITRIRQILIALGQDKCRQSGCRFLVKNIPCNQLAFQQMHIRNKQDIIRPWKLLLFGMQLLFFFHPCTENFCQFIKYIARLLRIGCAVTRFLILRPHMRQPSGKLPLFFFIRALAVVQKSQLHIRIAVIGRYLGSQQLCRLNGPGLLRPAHHANQLVLRQIQYHRHIVERVIIFFDKPRLSRQLVFINGKLFFWCLNRNLKRDIAHAKTVF